MEKPQILRLLGVIALTVSVIMFIVGGNSSHLSELQEFFWVPLPLALAFFYAAKQK